MKKLVFFLFLSPLYNLLSQNTFVIDDIAGDELSAFCDFQLNENIYYGLAIHSDYDLPQAYSGTLYTFDEEGNQLNAYELGGKGIQYYKILRFFPDKIRMIGALENDTCNSILLMSDYFPETGELHHLSSLAVCHEENIIKRLAIVPGLNNQIFFEGGYGRRITNQIDHKPFLATLDSNEQLKMVFDPLEFSRSHFSIDFSRKNYILRESYITDFYDQNFNFRKRRMNFAVRYDSDPWHYSVPFGNYQILDQAEMDHTFDDRLAIRLVDSNLYVRKEVLFPSVPGESKSTKFPMFGGISKSNDSIAWIATNWASTSVIGAKYFSIIKVDNELNVLCHQFIGFDAYYEVYGLTTFENDGAILYGMKRPLTSGIFTTLQDVYAIKVNDQCELSTAFDDPEKIMYTISVFPNPAINSITFNVNGFDASSLQVEIYNTAGSVLFSQKDLSHEIHVTDLPAGQYFYRISKDKEILGAGSWVKK